MRLVESAGWIPTSFRTLPPFRLARPERLEQVDALLRQAGDLAFLAGGTDLVARFNEGFAPTDVIDLSRIQSLHALRVEQGRLLIGACVTHAKGAASALVRDTLPGFARAWARIANVRVRMAATLGGNLMARRTRYEGAVLAAALDARLRMLAPSGEAEVSIADFCAGKTPSRALLTEIAIPVPSGRRFDYERTLRPIMTQALVLDGPRDGVIQARLAVATEYLFPHVFSFAIEASRPVARLAEIATATFASLPRDFRDAATSNDYLRRAGAVLLRRQLERLA